MEIALVESKERKVELNSPPIDPHRIFKYF